MIDAEAFTLDEAPRGGGRPCSVCSNRDIKRYIHDCLQMTLDNDLPRPKAITVFRRCEEKFEGRAPKENTMRRHLHRCEPLWRATFIGEEEPDTES